MPATPTVIRCARGWAVPGVANLHSHAFQRAMAGMAERQTNPADSFWTWRETMYAMAARFDPDLLQAVATQLYVEMLEAGYTRVCEFHYLHHAPDGTPYAAADAMSVALIAAARASGIRITLLPVVYMRGGFDGRALGDRQRRFGLDVDTWLQLFHGLRRHESETVRIGCALHSLRAVPREAMHEVLAALPADTRIHIHIAEQQAEVDECIAVHGARPVRWLLDHASVDERWTLVHATHLDAEELQGIASSGATVAICPSTEANLGDGLFPLRAYLDVGLSRATNLQESGADGRVAGASRPGAGIPAEGSPDARGFWGIGSDSHASVSPVEELRWLEYGQRLATRQRNIAVTEDTPSVGETLLHGTQRSAARSTGFTGEDLVVLDDSAPILAGAHAGDVVDRWIFSGNRPLVRDVEVAGMRVVEDGRHRNRDAIAARYRAALQRLLA